MALATLTPLALAAFLVAATPLPETQFAASATPTHFRASNPNDYAVLLILGDAAYGARAQMLVAPFMEFETSFPSGTLDDLYMEVVFFAPTGRVSSGAVSFDDMLSAGAECLEVETELGGAEAWICTGELRLDADTGLHLTPSSLLESPEPPWQAIMIDPTHVPALTPEDAYDNTWAPKIQSSHPTI